MTSSPRPRPSDLRSASAWRTWVDSLGFRRKLELLPRITSGALGLIFLITLAFGGMNYWRLQRIVDGYHPAVETSRDLQDRMAAIQANLQQVVATRDPGQLSTADTVSAEAAHLIDSLRHNPVVPASTSDSLAQAFADYATAARFSAEHLAMDESSDTLIASLRTMTARRRDVERLLATTRSSSTAAAHEAARTALILQGVAWAIAALITLAALIAVSRLSAVVTEGVVQPVAAAAQAATQVARGELTEVPEWRGADDELAALMRAMQEMGDYLREMAVAADAVASGDVRVAVTPRSDRDAFGQAFARMAEYLRSNVETADRIAAGDLEVQVVPQGERDAFGNAFRTMTDTLSRVIADIRSGAEAIAAAADHLTRAAIEVSEGAHAEAATIQATHHSLEAVNELIAETAESSRAVEQLARKGAEDAETSGSAVRETTEAMGAITEHVDEIQRIARQTNLLALNASIEAARAGEHGLGFNVVAGGVRELSDRSKATATEVGQIASRSQDVARRSAALIAQLVPVIRQTAHSMQEVAAMSVRQSERVQEVEHAMAKVDDITRRNAAAAQQLAATAEEFSAQATALRGLVSFFRVHDAVTREAAQRTAEHGAFSAGLSVPGGTNASHA